MFDNVSYVTIMQVKHLESKDELQKTRPPEKERESKLKSKPYYLRDKKGKVLKYSF